MADASNIAPVMRLRRDDVQSGAKLMTAAMQVVYTDFSTVAYMFSGGFINLSSMLLGDTIIVRIRKVIEPLGAFTVVDQTTYINVQPVTHPMAYISPVADIYGFEIAMQQTAGVFRTIPCEFFVSKRIGL